MTGESSSDRRTTASPNVGSAVRDGVGGVGLSAANWLWDWLAWLSLQARFPPNGAERWSREIRRNPLTDNECSQPLDHRLAQGDYGRPDALEA